MSIAATVIRDEVTIAISILIFNIKEEISFNRFRFSYNRQVREIHFSTMRSANFMLVLENIVGTPMIYQSLSYSPRPLGNLPNFFALVFSVYTP